MKEIVEKVYQFGELSEKAQEKVIEDLWDCNVDYGWWVVVEEDMEGLGIEISFDSGDCVFGRGNCVRVDVENGVSFKEVAQNILNEHDPISNATQMAEKYLESVKGMGEDDDWNDVNDVFRKELEGEIDQMFREEYEYRTSRDRILETISMNKWYFYEDGRLYGGIYE